MIVFKQASQFLLHLNISVLKYLTYYLQVSDWNATRTPLLTHSAVCSRSGVKDSGRSKPTPRFHGAPDSLQGSSTLSRSKWYLTKAFLPLGKILSRLLNVRLAYKHAEEGHCSENLLLVHTAREWGLLGDVRTERKRCYCLHRWSKSTSRNSSFIT